MKPQTDTRLTSRDIAEIAIGGMIMAMPMAVTEEIWVLSDELGIGRILLVATASIVFIALFIWSLIYHEAPPADRRHFRRRVAAAYLVALLISATMLLAIDRLPLLSDPVLALKRTILVALPVAFGGTALDDILSRE